MDSKQIAESVRINGSKRINRKKRLDAVLKEVHKKMAAKITEYQAKKFASNDPAASEYQQSIERFKELQAQLNNRDQFAIDFSISRDFDGVVNFEDAKKRIMESIQAVSGFLGKTVTFGKELSDEEKQYVHDVVLLFARDRCEYVNLCNALGFPVKRDPIEWPLIQLSRKMAGDTVPINGAGVLIDHPCVTDAGLNADMAADFKEIVTAAFNSQWPAGTPHTHVPATKPPPVVPLLKT